MIRNDLLFAAMETWWKNNLPMLESLNSHERQLVEAAFGLDSHPRQSLKVLARRDGSNAERVFGRLAAITKRANELKRKRERQLQMWIAEQTGHELPGNLLELGVEPHIRTALAESNFGIRTIEHVRALSDEELSMIPGIGPAMVRQIRLAIESHDSRAKAQSSAR